MALIPITGIPSSWRLPSNYAEILFGQGPATAGAGERAICICGPKLAASGSWTANTVYRVKNEAEAIAGAGAGSPLHRCLRMVLKANNGCKLYALPYLPSSGAGGVAAACDVTIACGGVNPTASGQVKLFVCGEEISVGYTTTSTPTSIATDIKNSINAKTWLPVSALNAAGVLTLTAKILGKSQGDGTLGVIRLQGEIDSGTGTTITLQAAALGLGASTDGVDGATTEATNLAAALAAIESSRYYYLGFASVCHTAEWQSIALHIANKSLPLQGLRSVGVVGYTGALAGAQTLATARNYERLRMVWQPNSDHDVAELVGNAIAVFHKRESTESRYNFDGYRGTDWLIHKAYSVADWPDAADLNDAITDGITPIASDEQGSYIVMSVNTRSKDSTGTVDDFRACESHRVSISDEYCDTVLVRHKLTYGGFYLADDKLLSDGTVDPNQPRRRKVLTPSAYKPFVNSMIDEFEAKGLLQKADTSKSGLQVVRDPNNGGRLEVGHDLFCIDLLHQTTFRFAETSSG